MAYTQYTYRFSNSVEYEFHYAGRYGLKGEHRAKRKRNCRSSEEIQPKEKDRQSKAVNKSQF